MNRLRTSETTFTDPNKPSTVVEYDYDVLGNMIYRSDVGTMNYGENGFGPHTVTSVLQNQNTNITENVFNPFGSYLYDANGNLDSNGQRTVDWTAFNKPNQIATVIDGEARGVTYTYGSDFQRITKTTLSGKKTRYYGGGVMEHIVDDGVKYWKYYIPVGATTLELKYKQIGNNIFSATFEQIENQYLFKDHLGSTDVIVDDNGNIVEHLSFNPWGERRDADWTEANSEITSNPNRGFTGHEMDDEIGLINMNARIYDPVIGRFLSPDALIPSPADLQSYNRYSYVRNNPLSYTDPTGNFRFKGSISGSMMGGFKGSSIKTTLLGTFSGAKSSSSAGGGRHNVAGSSVPGFGNYRVHNGNVYQIQSYVKTYNGKGNEVYGYYMTLVTDPGMLNHIGARIGVVNEVIDNYGGLSRGNLKETRNKYRSLAAQELAANGKTALYQNYQDMAYAANNVYKWYKKKKRSGYIKMATQIAMAAMSGNIVSGLQSTAAQAVGSGLSSVAMSGGDLKAGLAAMVTAGLTHGLELGSLESISAGDWGNVITDTFAQATIQGVGAEIQGDSFSEAFRFTFAVAGLSNAALKMRSIMVDQSMKMGQKPGGSMGFRDDGFDLGGCRPPCTGSWAGGIQGNLASKNFLGIPYKPNSFLNFVVESFAGPHDFLNSGGYHWSGPLIGQLNSYGQSRLHGIISWINVPIAAPLSAASIIQPAVHDIHSIINDQDY